MLPPGLGGCSPWLGWAGTLWGDTVLPVTPKLQSGVDWQGWVCTVGYVLLECSGLGAPAGVGSGGMQRPPSFPRSFVSVSPATLG